MVSHALIFHLPLIIVMMCQVPVCIDYSMHPVDVLSALNLHKWRRFLSQVVDEDEEASCFVNSFLSDHGYEGDSAWESAKL